MKSPSLQKLTTLHSVALALCDGPHSWSVLLPELEQSHLLPITVSLTEFFAMRHQEPELYHVLKLGTLGFGWAQVLGERS